MALMMTDSRLETSALFAIGLISEKSHFVLGHVAPDKVVVSTLRALGGNLRVAEAPTS